MTTPLVVDFAPSRQNHVSRFVADLLRVGWELRGLPDGAVLVANRQLIELIGPDRGVRLRVSIFKVGDRGEGHRRDERRIEITTTFQGGLARLRSWRDVVLGYDVEGEVYVGLDARRLELGGATHNASSSVPADVLAQGRQDRILVAPHATKSFGLEYQAIFKAERLSEYLFNLTSIHKGTYLGDGQYSGRMRTSDRTIWKVPATICSGDHVSIGLSRASKKRNLVVNTDAVEAYENQDAGRLRDLSPTELDVLLLKCREVGDAGEVFAHQWERKRLTRGGGAALCGRIDWVSRRAVGRGYDIKSVEITGEQRYIEVKSSIQQSRTIFMSNNEWSCALRLGDAYHIYHVVNALSSPRMARVIRNPVQQEKDKKIVRVSSGWKITLRP